MNLCISSKLRAIGVRYRSGMACLVVASIALLALACDRANNSHEPVIWFQEGVKEFRTLSPRTLEQRTIIAEEPDTFVEAASLSPNGGKVAYRRTVLGQGSAIWIADADGSNRQRVTRDYEWVVSFWLTDSELATAGADSQGEDPFAGEVALYDLLTGLSKPLTASERPSCPNHPTAAHWAGITVPPPRYAVGHLEVTENRLETVTDIPVVAGGLEGSVWSCITWTADEGTILFDGGGYDNRDLFIAVDGGKTVRRITNFAQEYRRSDFTGYSLSPDGMWAAFAAELDGPRSPGAPTDIQVGLVRTDGSDLTLLMKAGLLGNLVWSPDSQYVAAGLNPYGSGPSDGYVMQIIDVTNKQISLVIPRGDQLVFDWR